MQNINLSKKLEYSNTEFHFFIITWHYFFFKKKYKFFYINLKQINSISFNTNGTIHIYTNDGNNLSYKLYYDSIDDFWKFRNDIQNILSCINN
jgi:hypothetical protein